MSEPVETEREKEEALEDAHKVLVEVREELQSMREAMGGKTDG